MLEKVRNIWMEVFGMDSINEDESFFDLGGNSLLGIMIIEDINALCGTKMSIIDLEKYDTVRKMSEFIQEQQNIDI